MGLVNTANLRDLIAATGLVILLKLDSNRRFFARDLHIWWMTPKDNKIRLLYYIKLCVSFQIHQFNQTGVTVRNRQIWVKFEDFFEPCDLAIRRMILKNNRAPFLCYFKLCASFRSHWWIQTGVTVRKRPIWVKIDDFFSRVTLPFDVWPFKNNRATLLCYFKLCASFRSHWWIQTGVTVRKRSFWVKIDNFISRVTLKFPVWSWKSIGHLFYATSSFVHHSVAIGEFKLELQSGNAQFWSTSTILRAV